MRFLRFGLGLLLVLVLAFFLRSSQGRTEVDARDVSGALDPDPQAQLEAPLAGTEVSQPVGSDERSSIDEASDAAGRVAVQDDVGDL